MCIFATSVTQQDDSQKNSPITDMENESTAMSGADGLCYWNGTAFKDGDKVCAEGTTYECSYGKWAQAQGVC